MVSARECAGGAWVLALALAACRGTPAAGVPTPSAREITSPAGPGSAEPSLAATEDGRFLLSWIEPWNGGHALRLASRRPREPWSPARTVAAGTGWFVNWADFPRVGALPDGTLFAHWLERNPAGGPHAYDVRIVRSTDGGSTWSSPVSPYRDRTPSEHGFVSLAPADDGHMGVLFLDGRATSGAEGPMALRFAIWGREGAPGDDRLVDARVCDCCQTSLARTGHGLVAAYRDRSDAETRDVAVRRLVGGAWSDAVFPGAEGWTIAACPVNGPAVSASGDRVALAWFTMAGEQARVRAALSDDAGATWSRPVTLDDDAPVGRVDVAVVGRGALVSWLSGTAQGAEIRARVVGRERSAGPVGILARTSAARASGFPQLEEAGGEIVAAWTAPGEPPVVRTAVVEGVR